MKIFFCALGYCVGVCGAPFGNPSMPAVIEEGFILPDTSWTCPEFGIIGDFLIEKRMRPCHGSQELDLKKAYISGTSQIGLVSWNIQERCSLQLQLGTGQFSWRWEQQRKQVIEGKSSGGVVWSGDAKLIVVAVKDTTLAIDGQAGGWDWMGGPATRDGKHVTDDARLMYRYWQLGLSASQKMAFFSPYIGLAITHARSKISNLPTGTSRMHAKNELGPFGGCSVSTGNQFSINLEWRGIFEDGATLSGQVRF